MSAAQCQFTSLVEEGGVVEGVCYMQLLLSETQVTLSIFLFVGWCSGNNAPLDSGGGVDLLFPDMGCKGSFMLTVSEGLSMPIPPLLKVHCAADVLLGLVTYDFGMINDISFIVAVGFQWTLMFVPLLAVAGFSLWVVLAYQHSIISHYVIG